ncbi:MAG: hypothetical protein IJO65_12175 [Lachnospiraceae bacterium]|nr:hypothetical protein [Lachnospiraceae bacterium]
MDIEKLRVCKKCLTRDMMDQAEYFKNLHEYIENLDEDVKVNQPLYEKRLMVCKDCNLLTDGMCRACGCFVELRAAVKKNACPYEKWSAFKEEPASD